MEDHGNNGIFGVDRKQTWAVDGKQETIKNDPRFEARPLRR